MIKNPKSTIWFGPSDTTIDVVCCVCGKFLGKKPAGLVPGAVSHGFCERCLEAWRQEQLQYIQERKKQCQ